MHHIRTLTAAGTHQVYRGLLIATGRAGRSADELAGLDEIAGLDELAGLDEIERCRRDRGAVSLEQVLWFVAAGVSVAVIASILWSQIRDEAETPVQSPSSP